MDVLTHKEELIVRAVACYRFMTAEDVARLLFSPSSLTHVREILLRLSGKDFSAHGFLYRFRLPDVKGGNPLRVYTLSRKGRNLLNANWHFRPDKAETLGFSHLHHALTLTKFLVASALWARRHGFTLTVRTCYELSARGDAPGAVLAIPDAWLLFERRKKHPILLEIDRGTEYQLKFKQHLASRIEFIQSGRYEEIFGIHAVSIAYVTISEARRDQMLTWLKEMALLEWERVFSFAFVPPSHIYSSGLFASPIWYQPQRALPFSLLTSAS